MKTNFLNHWIKICGVIVATGAALSAIYYTFGWKANTEATQTIQGEQVKDLKETITHMDSRMDSKIDKVASDTSEIKGVVKTLLELQRERNPIIVSK